MNGDSTDTYVFRINMKRMIVFMKMNCQIVTGKDYIKGGNKIILDGTLNYFKI